MSQQEPIIIPDEKLHSFCRNIFQKVGASWEDASLIATTLVDSNLYGVDSHGVIRLPGYLARFQAGGINPNAQITVLSDYPAAIHLDANYSIGQVTACRAMQMAIERAEQVGIAIVSLKNCSHFGRAGHYAMMALEHGMIGVAISNTNLIVSSGDSIGGAVGNNPISVAIPAGEEYPVVLDMACSVVSVGKIMGYAAAGEKVPLGWGLTKEGALTEEPDSILDNGYLLPFGGYKGFGIALVLGILSGVLSGAGAGRTSPILGDIPAHPYELGQAFIAIDVRKFIGLDSFAKDMDTMICNLKSLSTQSGEAVRIPGERLFHTYQIRKKQGIPIPPEVFAKLTRVAGEVGVYE